MIKLLTAVKRRLKSSVRMSVPFKKKQHYVAMLYENDYDFLVCPIYKKI